MEEGLPLFFSAAVRFLCWACFGIYALLSVTVFLWKGGTWLPLFAATACFVGVAFLEISTIKFSPGVKICSGKYFALVCLTVMELVLHYANNPGWAAVFALPGVLVWLMVGWELLFGAGDD